MSNPARDLLNFVDEHKTEMKDNTYIGIVEKIAPINKMIEENKKSKYRLFLIVTKFKRGDCEDCIHEADYDNKRVNVFLSDSEASYINEQLDEYGNINQIWFHTHEKTEGLQMVETIRSIFVHAYDEAKVHCRLGEDD